MQRVANDRCGAAAGSSTPTPTGSFGPSRPTSSSATGEALSGRVLELGSGAGRLTGYLAEIAAEVRESTSRAEMVAYSRRRYPRATFAQGDLRDPSVFGSTPWDAIVAPFNVVDVFGDGDRQILLDRVHAPWPPTACSCMSSHNRAVADRLGDPLRQVGLSPRELVSTAVHLPRRWLNRRRLVGFRADRAVVRDPQRRRPRLRGPALLHHPRRPGPPARGPRVRAPRVPRPRRVDRRPGRAAAHCSELHYVARRG